MTSAGVRSPRPREHVSAHPGRRRYELVLAPRRTATGLAGHEVISLDLPGDDPKAGLTAYVELALAAANGQDELVVAAQSMGAFTAVPVCERLAAR
jgi:hypothetical protein